MTDDSLALYIAGNDRRQVASYLKGRFGGSPRFRDFVYSNRDKIRKKVREANNEESIEDIAAELKVAYLLLLDDRFSLEYEKYMRNQSRRSPDLTAVFQATLPFNVEVKRIRKSPGFEGRFDKWYDSVVERVRKTPSSLGFSLDVTTMGSNVAVMNSLEPATDKVVDFCVQKIMADDCALSPNASREYRLPGFENLLRLTLVKPKNRTPTDTTALFGFCAPILSSGKEPAKFSNSVLEKVEQFVPQMRNVLIFKVSSAAHAYQDLQAGLDWLVNELRHGDETFFEKRGFQGREQFRQHWESLSAVLFLERNLFSATQPNVLWVNPDAAHQLPSEVCHYLEEMR